ncbi:sulfite exporter TauE/SafE family protein [Anaerofustis stercorihominis]|uniref:Probable membrane transporter protein n=1 Tax=Anaerofustis stercorihominis TaxID=214853 RepID=A0A3E3E069_9FIRM|nr:sulfite exporter TauE/SafE family protein [Anaerofustis stercorihominis]RGD74883.1 sulfite exporter TauE/SafE family protein [Anaerofustis stercorihominis]
MIFSYLIYIISGLGAGIGTGLAGLSAAAVISPMLITFLGFNAYEAVSIALASDVLASAVSAYIYYKNKNIDIKNGVIMLIAVLIFTVVGSYIASIVPNSTMGSFSVFMTFLLGIKFIVKPVMTTKENLEKKDKKSMAVSSVICGILIGFICGFIGAGGGIMMLLILTSVLGYELKTAVGTSVFIMTFTAFTGFLSHTAISSAPDIPALITCIIATFVGARVAALFANKSTPEKLNRITGIVLAVLGLSMILVKII